MPSWESAAADDLWTKACGKECRLRTTGALEQDIRRVSDTRLWQLRTDARTSLIEYARERLARQLAVSGELPDAVERRARA